MLGFAKYDSMSSILIKLSPLLLTPLHIARLYCLPNTVNNLVNLSLLVWCVI